MGMQIPEEIAALKPAELRERAAKLGLMTQAELRQRLGLSIFSFNHSVASGRTPAPKFTLSNGDAIFDRAAAEAYIQQMGK